MRTIVFSDIHGEPAVIRRVVEHSAYRPGTDRLVFAGDAIEVGRDSLGSLELLAELGAECLVGNHEFAVWDGEPIENECLDIRVHDAVTAAIDSGDWTLATSADGVLITHAGVCESFAADLGSPTGDRLDVEGLVTLLNAALASAVAVGPGRAIPGIAREKGPLWYRPSAALPPLRGAVQIAGHTPPEILGDDDAAQTWASRGLYLVDPFVRAWARRAAFRLPAPLRYALIEDGAVSVIHAGA